MSLPILIFHLLLVVLFCFRMDDFRHNPYVGSFHALPVKMNSESKSDELVMTESKTNPMVGLFRHSPPLQSNRVGLKSVIYEDPQLGFPIISRLRLNSLPRSALTGRTFLSSLRKIPVTVYSASSSASKSIIDLAEKSPTENGSCTDIHGDTRGREAPMCAICLEEYADGDELLTLACSHCFHSECANKWFYHGCINNAELQDAFRCPHCRQDHIALSEQCSHASGDAVIPTNAFLDVGQSLLRDGGYDFLSDAGSERSAVVRSSPFPRSLQSPPITKSPIPTPQKATCVKPKNLEESAYSDCGYPLNTVTK